MASNTRSALRIDANKVITFSNSGLRFALSEYHYFVHRFAQWFSLVVAKAEDPVIRQLLVPNLYDESGLSSTRLTHREMLERCITACGCDCHNHEVSVNTQVAESWFYGVYTSESLAACLGAMGPGTEEISNQFLEPLEQAVRQNFSVTEEDLIYFHEHRPEVEHEHVDGLRKSIERLVQISDPREEDHIRAEVKRWADMSIYVHGLFWRGVADSLAAG